MKRINYYLMIIVLMGGSCRIEYETETSQIPRDTFILASKKAKDVSIMNVSESSYLYNLTMNYCVKYAPKAYGKLSDLVYVDEENNNKPVVETDWNY